MKLRKPNKIAICFVDGNIEKSIQQYEDLLAIENDFIVEWNFRAKKFSGPYSSYSQLINEAVVETSSEFMVFINPKTIVTPEDIKTIINDLCNGYAWSSVCSLGLWGTTKELFRRIGLMDERFIGGEYEDNDLAFRLKEFGKAINWRFELSKYPWSQPSLPQMRGATRTLFSQKWHKREGIYYRTDNFIEEKRLPRHICNQSREDIYQSWMDWENTKSDHVSHVFNQADEAIISSEIVKTKKFKSDAIISLQEHDGSLRFEFKCNRDTSLQMVLTQGEIGQERPVIDGDFVIESNNYLDIPIGEGVYDIRFFHEGKLILNNQGFSFPNNLEYKIGINVTEFETF